MAAPGYIENQLTAISDSTTQRVLKSVFRYLLANLRLGRATAGLEQNAASSGAPSENFGAGFFSFRTHAVANTEFTVPHNFGKPPYLLVPCIPLDQVNAGTPRLIVTRVADNNNVYLKSPDADQAGFVFLEG